MRTPTSRLAALALAATFVLSSSALVRGEEKPKTPAGGDPKPASAPTTPDAKLKGPDPLVPAYTFADAVDDALVKAVASVQASSVTVWNLKKVKRPDGKEDLLRQSGGSGVLVAWKGKGPFVITNEHVVRGADRLEVTIFDGSTYEVRLKDHVKTYDIALVEFGDKKPKTYKPAKFGHSESLCDGQWVIATGNPFFLAADGRCVATLGMISGLDRMLKGDFTYANAIQHDAEVNPGNSGGPLWNLAGELVGINGMISSRGGSSSIGASNSGASFAIPIHLILNYFDDLMSDKVSASAGYLGIEVEEARDAAGKPLGARVKDVKADSPLKKKADARVVAPDRGDLITQVSLGSAVTPKSYPVFGPADLAGALAYYPAGTRVKVSFEHAGKKLTWTGELGGEASK